MNESDSRLLDDGVELSFGEIDGALTARREAAASAAVKASTATVVAVGPEARLPETVEVLQELGEHAGLRAILIAVGTGTRPAPRLLGNAVALTDLHPSFVNNAVAALRLSSLPTIVWWRGGSCDMLEDLAQLADHVVLDGQDARQAWARASTLFERASFSDLRWTRLTRWRTLMAHFFDIAEVRAASSAFTRLRIRSGDATLGSLFACWLETALGRPRQLELDLQETAGPPVIHDIMLGDGDQELTLRLAGHGSCVATSVRVQGHRGATRTVPLGDQSHRALLAEELRIRARDRAFEAAVAAWLERQP